MYSMYCIRTVHNRNSKLNVILFAVLQNTIPRAFRLTCSLRIRIYDRLGLLRSIRKRQIHSACTRRIRRSMISSRIGRIRSRIVNILDIVISVIVMLLFQRAAIIIVLIGGRFKVHGLMVASVRANFTYVTCGAVFVRTNAARPLDVCVGRILLGRIA